MVSIELNLSPIVVNLGTDVLLILLAVVWRLLATKLTELDLRADLRLRRRSFSLERKTSFEYYTYGKYKANYLIGTKLVDANERTRLRFETALSILGFTFTLALVAMHAWIDYGLDFQTKTSQTNVTGTYNVLDLTPNTEVARNMDLYRRFIQSTDFCMMGLTHRIGCRNRGAAVDDRLSTLIRESLMFGNTVFLTPSLSQMDVVDELEVDYSASRVKEPSQRDAQTTKCVMKEQYNALDFSGNFEFDEPDCVLRATFLRSLTLNLRAAVVRNFQIGIPVQQIYEVLVRIGIPTNTDYVSYKRFRDERQPRSTMNITRIKGLDEQSSPYSTARVSVDSRLVHADGAGRQIKITDLSRKWSRDDQEEPDFAIALTPLARQGGLCLDESDGGFEVLADLLYDGSKCGEVVGRAATGRCDRIRARKYTTWRGWGRVDISIQKAETVIALDEHSRCADILAGLSRERLAPNVPGKSRTFVLGLEFDVACTKGLNGSEDMDCVYGMGVVRRWNEKWKVNKSKRKESLAIVPLRSSASWIAIELVGGDPEVNAKLIDSTRVVLRNSFPELSFFSNRIAYRGRVLGAYAASATLPILGIISAQTDDSRLELYYHETTDVTVLHTAYIVGLLTLISACMIMAWWVGIRSLQESAVSRKYGCWIKVPTTTSEWVVAASQSVAATNNETFASKEKSLRKVGRGYESTYEWAVEMKQKLLENSMGV